MKSLLFALLTLAFSLSAHAESDWEYDGKKIHVIDMEPYGALFFNASDEASVPEEYLKKGVYIRAMRFNEDAIFKKAGDIIKEQFAKKGIKVVETVQEAGVAITFWGSNGTLDVAYAEFNTPIDEKQREWRDEEGILNSSIVFAPYEDAKESSNLRRYRSKISGGEKINSNEITYKRLNPGIGSELLLRMSIDQWIDRFAPSAKAPAR